MEFKTPSTEGILLGILLFFMMFGVGATIDLKQLKSKFIHPKGIMIGFICQYILLPFLSFIYCKIFNLNILMSVAMIIVGTTPGGVISNYFCLLINADVELSIAMTSFSSILSFAMIPLNGTLYIKYGLNSQNKNLEFDWFGMILSIIFLLSGLCFGLIISYINQKYYIQYTFLKNIIKCCVTIGTTALAIGFGYGLYLNLASDYPFYDYSIKDWLAPLLLVLSAWFLSLAFAKLLRLPQNSSVAVAIETSNQNTSLSLAILVLTLANDPNGSESYGIPVVYMILMYAVTLVFMFIFYKLDWVNSKGLSHVNDSQQSFLMEDVNGAANESIDTPKTASMQNEISALL
eukprot:509285_1